MVNSSKPGWSLREKLALAAILLAAAIFIFLRFGEFPVGAGMDDAYYIELARSVAEGRGPVIHLNDSGPGWRPDTFPLGFPLLLSPLALLMPGSVNIFKLVPMLAMASLIPVCMLMVRPAGVRRGLVLVALVCLNPWEIAYAVRVYSDLPFTAVSLAAVLLFLNLEDDSRPRTRLFIAMVIATGAAVMIRSIGLALVVAMVAHWLSLRQWRLALLFCGSVAVILLPHALASGGDGGGLVTRGYLNQILGGGVSDGWRLSLLAGNLIGYLKELPVVLLPVFGNPLENLAARIGLGSIVGPLQFILGILLLAGFVWGLIVSAAANRNRSRFLAIYLAVYGGVLLNFSGYPSGIQARLLLPVLPLFYLLLLTAGDRLPAGSRKLLLCPAVILVCTLSLGHNIFRVISPLNAGSPASGRVFIDPHPGSDWIRNNTDPGDLIMTRWPLRQHIHFLRPVVGYGTAGAKDWVSRIQRYQVDYIFLDSVGSPSAPTDLRIFLMDNPDRFEMVHHEAASGITVFRVGKSP